MSEQNSEANENIRLDCTTAQLPARDSWLDAGLAALAEEVIHEVAGSALFFEVLVRALEHEMDREDFLIASEELNKLRGLLQGLRGIEFPKSSRDEVVLVSLLEEACRQMRPDCRGRKIDHKICVAPEEFLLTDRAMAVHALKILVDHAASVTPASSLLLLTGDARELRIIAPTVGLVSTPPLHIWQATRDRGAVVRWVIATRYARALGWKVRFRASDHEATIDVCFIG